jgi:glycosyltransferase involved in cell wall biosynthesis
MTSNKPKILLLSDDIDTNSGIATMSREIVLGTLKNFDWVQLAVRDNHPKHGTVEDFSDWARSSTGVTDASLTKYNYNGYGDKAALFDIINQEDPDVVLHFTDPRFWIWLYEIEREVRQILPIAYYTIWDSLPVPRWNEPYYSSCDLLMCISKQTHYVVNKVLENKGYEDWQITYVPHGINPKTFYPIEKDSAEYQELQTFRKTILGEENMNKFVFFHNSKNMIRKRTSDLIHAYKRFVDNLPEADKNSTMLLLHTDPVSVVGTNLYDVIANIAPDCNIKFTNRYDLSQQGMNYLYNIADVTCSVSSNEGFGLSTAESVMAGTPIIVNYTGGLQDQTCPYWAKTGDYLTEKDYNDEYFKDVSSTRPFADKINTSAWAEVVVPSARTLYGSVSTPYLFDDIANYVDVANCMRNWYDTSLEYRQKVGILGRSHFMSAESGLSSTEMCNRITNSLNKLIDNWEPKPGVELYKVK